MICVQANEGATENGVFVAARPAFTTTSATPDQSSAGTLTLVRFAEWSMLACYFRQNEKLAKARYFDACQRIASECVEQPFLMVGDLNTGNQALDRAPGGTPFLCANRFDELCTGAMRMDRERQTSTSADGLDLPVDGVRRELPAALRREHIGRCPWELPQHPHLVASDWMSRWPALLDPRHM
jgi:hypothetical protein